MDALFKGPPLVEWSREQLSEEHSLLQDVLQDADDARQAAEAMRGRFEQLLMDAAGAGLIDPLLDFERFKEIIPLFEVPIEAFKSVALETLGRIEQEQLSRENQQEIPLASQEEAAALPPIEEAQTAPESIKDPGY